MIQLVCTIRGVQRLREVRRRSALGFPIVERLYDVPNGWALGARRGGALHLADETTWEVFVIRPDGLVNGSSAGFVTDAQLARAAARLAQLAVV